MDHDSRPLPEPQVFWLDDAVLVAYDPGPEEPAPDPPRTYGEQATRTLMNMHPLVQRVLRQADVPEADLPDLTQTVLVSVLDWWSKRCDEPTAAALREAQAYIAVTARHAAYRHHRGYRRRAEVLDPEALLADLAERAAGADLPAQPSPEETVLAEEARADLAAELDLDALGAATTPARWRVFYAWAVLSVPVDVLAEAERVPVPTVYDRLRRAREDLRSAVRRRRAARHGP